MAPPIIRTPTVPSTPRREVCHAPLLDGGQRVETGTLPIVKVSSAGLAGHAVVAVGGGFLRQIRR
ncbi:hypothetical protein [Mycolicibacterium wolinskyi]|uniref:hypothetical protein n=1 Tax=Mycolicibacterium wolinskyi TaxID=59750 RepID=UPI000A477EDD|nr:hypothetical protein [Mycolicibacterium wolinskyi]